MREIEFRGLRKDGKGWVYGGLVLCNGSYTVGSYIGKKLKKVGNIHEGGLK